MPRLIQLALFIVLTVGGGGVIGFLTAPGAWYAELAKPGFNPPNWLFAPVWTLLYIVIAVAGWRVWQRSPADNVMNLWWIQLLLNFAWSPTFFAVRSPGLALLVIVLLLAKIIGFIAQGWNRDRLAAWLFVPYAAWVAFATVLNAAIVWLN